MGDPDKEHAVTLRHPQTKGDRHGQGPTKKQSGGQETQKKKIKVIAPAPSQKRAGVVMSDKLPSAAV